MTPSRETLSALSTACSLGLIAAFVLWLFVLPVLGIKCWLTAP
jgi:hypothetical protein